MSTVTAPIPPASGTVKRPKLAWRNGHTVQETSDSPPAAPPPQATTTDEETFTVSSGKGKSPDVEPGVYVLVITDVRRETGPNPFEPGSERTSYIFHASARGMSSSVTRGTPASRRCSPPRSEPTRTHPALAPSRTRSHTSDHECPSRLGRQALIEVTERGDTRIANLFPS